MISGSSGIVARRPRAREHRKAADRDGRGALTSDDRTGAPRLRLRERMVPDGGRRGRDSLVLSRSPRDHSVGALHDPQTPRESLASAPLRGRRRSRLLGRHACLRGNRSRSGRSGHLDHPGDHRQLRQAPRPGPGALGRSMAGGKAGRRAVRRVARWRVLRRVDVPPGDRRVEDRACWRWSSACGPAGFSCSTRSG